MAFHFRIYARMIRISMQSRLQYRSDFLAGIAGIVIFNAVNIGLIGIIVTRFVHLNGWSVWELLFLYSLWILGHSLYSLFFWHFNSMETYLLKGTFDQFLIRPVSPLLQLLGREVQYLGAGDAAVGIAGLSIAYAKLDLDWSVFDWLYFGLAVVSGTGIEVAVFWTIASLAFWTKRSLTATSVIWRLNSLVQQYPVDIFGSWFRVFVTGFVPVAFMNYYPSLVLLGKDGDAFIPYLSPVVALISLLVASRIWRLGVNRYASSGN
ncbi:MULTISPECIES: ABC transporter permease [Cohnella]|uniref:ABC transporter permease n=1 Tax=Cohnella TaxID=329857 RepID=UPI0009BAB87C|nr:MULTISPECIES: ABC-2 family transporter protein [Cohnella]MBN2982521.1 ABC-2 family transporter protein [Cohnella algarum]